jgi:hypothetical protein
VEALGNSGRTWREETRDDIPDDGDVSVAHTV